MNQPIFSTAYLPSVLYMAAICHHETATIEIKETFPKQTYRNRAHIITAGGVRALTVPTVRTNHSRTEEVGIDYHTRWNIVHLRTLTAAYAASPYFDYYHDELQQILMQQYARLVDLNHELTSWLMKQLHITTQTAFSTDFIAPCGEPYDYRYKFSPKRKEPLVKMKPYYQVFADRMEFVADMSVVDLLMNLGPEAHDYLTAINLNPITHGAENQTDLL